MSETHDRGDKFIRTGRFNVRNLVGTHAHINHRQSALNLGTYYDRRKHAVVNFQFSHFCLTKTIVKTMPVRVYILCINYVPKPN